METIQRIYHNQGSRDGSEQGTNCFSEIGIFLINHLFDLEKYGTYLGRIRDDRFFRSIDFFSSCQQWGGFTNSLSLNSLSFHTLNLLQISQIDQQLELTSLELSSLGHATYGVKHFSFIFLIINFFNAIFF